MCVNYVVPMPRDVVGTVSVTPVLENVTDEKGMLDAVDDGGEIVSGSQELVYGGGEWYPTLAKTLFILGKLYGAVPPGVFTDLSQEAVEICRASLVEASFVISGKQTALDGQLFLIKNLLMLREKISRFEGNFVRTEDALDLSSLQDVIASLIHHKWSSLASLGMSLVAAGTPRVVEKVSDARGDVDRELKRVCEDVVLGESKGAVEGVGGWLLKVQAWRGRSEGREVLTGQSFASGVNVLAVFKEFKSGVAGRFGVTVGKMARYLGDRKTEGILVRVVRSHILETYQGFYDLVSANYGAEVVGEVWTLGELGRVLDGVVEGGE
jgi:hypothetical protein